MIFPILDTSEIGPILRPYKAIWDACQQARLQQARNEEQMEAMIAGLLSGSRRQVRLARHLRADIVVTSELGQAIVLELKFRALTAKDCRQATGYLAYHPTVLITRQRASSDIRQIIRDTPFLYLIELWQNFGPQTLTLHQP